MTPQEWSRIQQGIFEGESGGDYGALFGYQNRPGGKFSNIDLTKMTIDEALEFANPSGNYGQFVKGQVGRVATPMGAYQVVGSTLRDAKKGLGLSGQETMSKDMQDQIGKWIYKTQGTGAWEGYKPLSEDQAIASQTLQVLGKSPKGILAPTQTSETETKPMMQQQKPRGLLERLGVQKMEEGAEGEAGQRFYNRESFGDTLANLAPALGRMGVMGLDVPAQAVANSRREDKLVKAAAAKTEAERNSTGKWLVENGFKDIGEGVLSGAISGTAGLQMSQKAAPKDNSTSAMKNYNEYQRILAEQGPDAAKQFLSTIKSGNTINMGDVGQGDFIYGSKAGLPAGYRLDKRTGEASVIPGGPAEKEINEQESKLERQEGGGSIMGKNVLQTAKRVRELISPYSVGYGSLLSGLPESDARELRREVDALGAIASSENLNAMREASPTGGALGNVSDKDIKLLKDKSGAIDIGSKPDQFRNQVDEYELFLLQTIHGPEAGLDIFKKTREVNSQPASNDNSAQKTKTGVTYKVIGGGAANGNP